MFGMTKQTNSFSFKTLITTGPLLQYVDFSRPFTLTTDASNDATGAILIQGSIVEDPPPIA